MEVVVGALFAIFQVIGLIIFKYYGWVPIALALAYMAWQNRRREVWVNKVESVLLRIEVPKENENKGLSAEQMFASLHGILRPGAELAKEGSLQEHFGLEMAMVAGQLRFYVWTPKHLKDFVEGQIYAQYPNVHIYEDEHDYSDLDLEDKQIYSTELSLEKSDVLPIKTFPSFEVDPLAGITAVMSSLDSKSEQMWVQVLARPIGDKWHEKGKQFVAELKDGKKPSFKKELSKGLLDIPLHIIGGFIPALFGPAEAPKKEEKKSGDKDDKPTGQQAVIKAVEEKITKLGYGVKIRVVYIGSDDDMARRRLQALIGGFKQFNTINLNGFVASRAHNDPEVVRDYRARLFMDSGSILNIEELASVYHLPHKSVETPNMVWNTAKTAEPPANLPTEDSAESDELSLFAATNHRGHKVKFGIKRADRGRHLYIVGQTGTGKSFLLQLLTLSDIYANQGIAIVDPHGDFATDIMKYIPENRLKDVIYFNPADKDFPIAFNPMEVTDPNFKNNISSEIVGVLKRMFESWGPRLEYILRFTILALLDYPDSTMLDITRMLTDKEFRKKVIREIKDPVVKTFWVNEFASWNDKFASEAVAPVLNKVGAFTANPLIRNVVGQPKSKLNLRQIMDEGKILIVNLSQGLIGEDNASVLGALMVTKIQLAAMSRANIDRQERKPFYLYVDEFQNFATDSFAVILSEARKYGLNLTVANQYIAQMPDTVKEAVFGNVGSIVTFRIGAGDAAYLGKYFEPTFEPGDLVKLNNQEVLVSMSISGEKSQPFSGRTLRMPETAGDLSDQIISLSRTNFASTREAVEDRIMEWTGMADTSGEPDPHAPEQKANIIRELQNPQSSRSAAGPNRQNSGGYQGNRDRNRPRHGGGGGGRPGQGQSQQHVSRPQPHQQQPASAQSSGQSNSEQALKPDQSINLRK